jgi:uncharacterized protein (DUF305 family)
MTADLDETVSESPVAPAGHRSPIVAVLAGLIVVALVAAGVALGYVWGNSGHGSTSVPSDSSVDVGFARDMETHHEQAVQMAGYERDNTANSALHVLAFDIETSQEFQIGQMQGWLDGWGYGRQTSNTPMLWMGGTDHVGADGLMPGMASPAEISKLESMHGKALDIFFLQLMIRHHQGGIPMAQYAVDHAKAGYVKTLAAAIVAAQSSEVIAMEQTLRELGGAPLPAPAH